MINLTIFRLAFLLLMFLQSCKSSKDSNKLGSHNWKIIGDSEWVFDEGQILGKSRDGSIGFILTMDEFKDFVLELEFYPDSIINSGIFIRCDGKNPSAADCYEVNIWDLNPNQDYRTGGIVNKFSRLEPVETINKWNHCKIMAKANHLKVWINGVLTLDVNDRDHTEGYIALQSRGEGKIAFKNITIKEID